MNLAIEGRPPLCLASDYGQLDVIKYLLDKGANVDVSDSENERSGRSQVSKGKSFFFCISRTLFVFL